jgi:transcriptional regulator with XRE-family HTH domain
MTTDGDRYRASSPNLDQLPEVDWLDEYFFQSGIDVDELSSVTGYSAGYISAMRTGRMPQTQSFIRAVAGYSGYTLPELSEELAFLAQEPESKTLEPELVAIATEMQLYSGEQIRLLRRERMIPQTELASQLGISKSYLSHLEAGRRPMTPALQQKISDLGYAKAPLLPKDTEVMGTDRSLEQTVLGAVYKHLGKLVVIAHVENIPVPQLVEEAVATIIEEYRIDPAVQAAFDTHLSKSNKR